MPFEGSREQFYRQRADELREMAKKVQFPDLRAQLEKIAREYDALADQVARRSLKP